MSQINEQKRNIEDILAIQYITSTFRDISASQLKTLRERFERNTSFREELRTIYHTVWYIAEQTGKIPPQDTSGAHTLYVAYTTNHHFYGSLNSDVVQQCIASTEASDHCLVIGDTGKQLWVGGAKKRSTVDFLSFKGDTPTREEIRGFLKQVAVYSRIFVFYPSFISVFQQKVRMMDVTFRPKKTQKTVEQIADLAQYILEPNLEGMLAFFNTQVRYALFEQLLLETELSRVAARLVKMDTADQNAEERLKEERLGLRRANASSSSRRMLETLLGFIQWNTTHKPHIV